MTRSLRLCLAALLLVPLLCTAATAAPKLLVCLADAQTGDATDLQLRLTATNAFAAVEIFDCNLSTPTLTKLKGFEAVLVFGDPSGYFDAVTLGDNLADYVDAGGGVVQGALNFWIGNELLGRWSSGGYSCLIPDSGGSFVDDALTSTPKVPQHPVVQGVTGISSPVRTTSPLNTARGAISLWDWNDGTTGVCAMSYNGHPRIDMNWYPGPPGTFVTELVAGDSTLLLKNALLFVAGGFGPFKLMPASLAFPDTGVGATTSGMSVVYTNGSASGATVNSITITGGGANDFVITSAPTTPTTIAPGATMTVGVAFAPTVIGARAATLKVGVNGLTGTVDAPLSGTGLGPKLVIAPSPLKLGSAQLGVPVQKTLTVGNQGGGQVKVVSAAISLGGGEFTITAAPSFPISLASGASIPITIQFLPAMTGMRVGELTVTSDDPNTPTVKVSLIGLSGPPALSLDAGSVAFGVINVGATSPPQVVTITNTGFSDLSVTGATLAGANPGDFVLDQTALPITLAPSATAQLSVSFAPTATGNRAATVTVASDDPNSPNTTLSLLGTATTATLVVTPTSLQLGTGKVGEATTSQSITIGNPGTGTLKILALTFSGTDAGSFVKTTGPSTPFGVAAGGSQPLGIACKALKEGALTATATVVADVGMQAVTLTCTGVAPKIAVTPNPVAFGSVTVGASSGSTAVTISNGGTASLVLASVTVQGAQASDFTSTDLPPANTVVAAGSSTVLHLRFTPSRSGAESGDLVILSDAGTVHVPLTGSGVLLKLDASPQSLDFGLVPIGTTATRSLTLTSSGDGAVEVKALTIGGTGAVRFGHDGVVPLTIGQGQTVTLMVRYSPVSAVHDAATLTVAPTGLPVLSIALSGTGVAPTLTVTPSRLDYGPIPVGTTSLEKEITVHNKGAASISLESFSSTSPAFTVTGEAGTLGAGGSAVLKVTFAPSSVGAQSGDVEIHVKGSTVPFKVPATGMGVMPDTGGCGCTVGAARAPLAPTWLLLIVVAALGAALLMRARRRSL